MSAGPGWDVRYGNGAIAGVPELVAVHGAERVLLVCGQRSFEASGAAQILPRLELVAHVRRWSGFAPNPEAADLGYGLRVVDEFGPDLVLGVGGGSAMDMAKLLCAYQGITDQSKLREAIRGGEMVNQRRVGLVLAPSTSGPGSEATHFAVVYIGDDKFSVAGPGLRPDVAILDPELSTTGTCHQRASSGIDAVAQAIESLWAVAATEQSRRWARHALGLLLPAIATFVADGTEATARAMAIGSHLAGRAIDTSRTTAAHALSYGMTRRYGISHGHAVALTLGAFLEAHDHPDPGRLRADPAVHTAAMAEVYAALGAWDGTSARAAFQDLLARIGLASSLAEVGVTDVRALAKGVNEQRLRNNPVRFDDAALVALLAPID